MPWATPTLRQVRGLVRDAVHASLPGSDANVPNSVLRVLSDSMGALCHLTLQYIDWLALQFLPDTAETEWLDRHGDIWLVNADGSTGRKQATLAVGTAQFTALADGVISPANSQLQSSVSVLAGTITEQVVEYETLDEIALSTNQPSIGRIRALDPGAIGNLPPGNALSFTAPPPGVDTKAYVVELVGGTDTETDEELRMRVLQRIRKPPAGGDADDFVTWTLAVPGVTRAWCSPLEMGMGTVTVRFMMDDLRASNDGFPTPGDVLAVQTYLDSVRPVAVKDFFVVAPIPEFINFQIVDLVNDDAATRAAIEASVDRMITEKAAPAYAVDGVPQEAQTIYREWVSAAIMDANGVDHFDLVMEDHPMPNAGCIGVLGDITYG